MLEQTKRVVGVGERANGNAMLGLLALTGVVGWGMTAMQAGSGGDMVALIQPVTVAWTVIWFAAVGWAALRVKREAVLSVPMAVWVVLSLSATAANAYVIANFSPSSLGLLAFVWLPWLVMFAVGYVVTALWVERPGVYWIAGLVSTALLAYGVYCILTGTGHNVVGSGESAAVLAPVPYIWTVLGVLHVVPMAIDALRGGRQMTAAGVPALRGESEDSVADEEEEEATGGVVPQ